MRTDYVYLIHFFQPISDKHTCQHYLGSAADVNGRFQDHLSGRGARLTQVAIERGINFQIVKVWQAPAGKGRELERQLKKRKDGHSLCPICADARRRRKEESRQRQSGQAPAQALIDFTLDQLTELAF